MTRAAFGVSIAIGALCWQDPSSPPREIDVTVTEGTSMAAAASPDRRFIAIDLLGSLWILPFHGGEARKITPDSLEAHAPTWEPHGRALAFEGFGDDGFWHIYVIDADGEGLRAITGGSSDDREPAWSHDGSRILFSSDRAGGARTIWEVMPHSGAMRQITVRPGSAPSWGPGDRAIAYLSATEIKAESGIWTIDASGPERLLVPQPESASLGPPAWNGSRVTFPIRSRSEVRLVTGQLAPMNEDVSAAKQQWLTRSEMLYTADGHIKRRNVNNLVNVIPFRAKISLERPTYGVRHRVLEPSEPQRLGGIVSPVVSPEGKRIAFAALGDLWVLPIGERPIRVTDDPFVELDPAWSPDGFKLAFASDRNGRMNLWVHDFRAGIAVPVTNERGRVTGPSWSPDGTQIAFLVDRANVHSVTLTTNTTRVWPGNDPTKVGIGEIGRPTWALNGHWVAVSSLFLTSSRAARGLNQLLLLARDTSARQPVVLFPEHSVGNRRSHVAVWSPDGLRMAFAGDGKLWTVGVDAEGRPASSPVVLSEDWPETPSWQSDSKRLFYLTPSGLRHVRADGGTPEPIALDLGWAPSRPPQRIVVHAGAVFDAITDTLGGLTDIVIDHGYISEVVPHNDERHAGTVVDAWDQTVMPGLIDTHAHLDPTYGEALGRIWLAYGVTSVRDPSIDPYAGLELREAVANGRRIGPRVFMAGDPIDGSRVSEPGGVSIASEPQLDAALDRAARLGVDFVTMRGRPGGRLEQRLAAYAHGQGLRATTPYLFPAIRLGFDGLDRLPDRVYRDVTDVVAKAGIVLTPMLSAHLGFEASVARNPSILRDPRLGLFPPNEVRTVTDINLSSLDAALRPRREAVKAVVSGGGRVVSGTDAPRMRLPYGLSLHTELEQFVNAGLTPFQALLTATAHAADALGAGDQLGTIEPGRLADLVFLGGDPLQDIRNTRDVRRVMRGGRLYDLQALGVAQQPAR